MKVIDPSVSLEWITPLALKMVERAGRTCYKSECSITDDSASKFIVMIKQRGHESVVEHAVASFRIICDRGVSHEIVRHRIASFSQESTRYCNYSKDKFGKEVTFIKPVNISGSNLDFWEECMRSAESNYFSMLDRGYTPQMARSVLPNSLKTELVMTANFREWMHFLELRTSSAAHPQMQQIALMIKDVLVKECPEVFSDC